jgi:hypothetical protein
VRGWRGYSAGRRSFSRTFGANGYWGSFPENLSHVRTIGEHLRWAKTPQSFVGIPHPLVSDPEGASGGIESWHFGHGWQVIGGLPWERCTA